jgi:hypothetical protein
MRNALKLLLLLGLGVLLTKDRSPDGTDGTGDDDADSNPGGQDNSEERDERLDFQGKNASTDMAGVHDTADQASKDGRAEDADGDGNPDITGSDLPTRSELPPFNISPSQFGKKWGKHSHDYGLDPADPASRQWFQNRAAEVHDSPDDVRVGPYNPNGGGGSDYVFFRQGNDLVIMKPNGDFVTMFPMDPNSPNGWYQSATSIQ